MRDRVPDFPSRRTAKVWVEQAIFTSLPRHGRGGYHLVSRSKRVSGEEAQAISRWSPSHGSLLQDQSNRVSVNFFSLPGGRFALSRSCEGPPEYSGRGGRQLYTHILIVDNEGLQEVSAQPFVIYHNALALGHMYFRPAPPRMIEPVELPAFHLPRTQLEWIDRAEELGLPDLRPLRNRIQSGRAVRFPYSGDRTLLAECLIGCLNPDDVRRLSSAT